MRASGLLLGIALCAGCVPSARAGDLTPLPAWAPSALYPVASYWSGAYVGAHIGGAWENAVWVNSFDELSDHAEPVGFIGGGQIGYNFQIYSWMLGIEGDLAATSLVDRRLDAAGFTYGIQTNWVATVAGRLGYDFWGRLVYVKGGIAFANSRETVTDANGDTATGNIMTRTGWTAGVGVEFLLYGNWSARVEYDYLNFGPQNLDLTIPQLGIVTNGSTVNLQILTAGINYRF
jgi:outer membrane immunogenic protein